MKRPSSFVPLAAGLLLASLGSALAATHYVLQSATDFTSTALWTTNLPAPVVIGGQNVVTNLISGPRRFYRLIH